MKLCFPTVDNRGMESQVHQHFGTAPFYTVIDTDHEDPASRIVKNDNANYHFGRCQPVQVVIDCGVSAVLVRKMGRKAVEKFNAAGVQVYMIDTFAVIDALRDFKTGGCKLLLLDHACHGQT